MEYFNYAILHAVILHILSFKDLRMCNVRNILTVTSRE